MSILFLSKRIEETKTSKKTAVKRDAFHSLLKRHVLIEKKTVETGSSVKYYYQ
jgi:hypothetical protein